MPVSSVLCQRRRGSAHDHGVLTAHKLQILHVKRILGDTAPSGVWAPGPSPRTALTGTTRRPSSRMDRVTPNNLPSAVGAGQDLGEAPPRESRGSVAVAAGHVLVGDERVGDGFFGGLDDGLKERVDLAPWDEGEAVVLLTAPPLVPDAALRVATGESPGVGGGDREE